MRTGPLSAETRECVLLQLITADSTQARRAARSPNSSQLHPASPDRAGTVAPAGPYSVLVDTGIRPLPPECGAGVNVRKGAIAEPTTITAGLAQLPAVFTTTTCVVIRDAGPYEEQVDIQGFDNAGWPLRILADPSMISSMPVIAPPLNSTAAFQVMNASVTLEHPAIRPEVMVPYGIIASSAHVTISSAVVHGSARIYVAALDVKDWSTITAASVTMSGGSAISVNGANNLVAYSSATNGTSAPTL